MDFWVFANHPSVHSRGVNKGRASLTNVVTKQISKKINAFSIVLWAKCIVSTQNFLYLPQGIYGKWTLPVPLPYRKMQRHTQTTGYFKQQNQKIWPEIFTRTISGHFWEMVHTFKHFFSGNKKTKPFFCVFLIFFRIFYIFVIKFNHEKALIKWTKNTQV